MLFTSKQFWGQVVEDVGVIAILWNVVALVVFICAIFYFKENHGFFATWFYAYLVAQPVSFVSLYYSAKNGRKNLK